MSIRSVKNNPHPRALLRAQTALRSAGEWLRVLQQSVAPRDPTAAAKDYRAYLNDRLRLLVGSSSGAFTADNAAAALRRFDQWDAQLSASERAPVSAHADFCPANVLVADDRIAVIDLAMSTDRVKTLDLAHMYFHLELLARRMPRGAALVAGLRWALRIAAEMRLRSTAAADRAAS